MNFLIEEISSQEWLNISNTKYSSPYLNSFRPNPDYWCVNRANNVFFWVVCFETPWYKYDIFAINMSGDFYYIHAKHITNFCETEKGQVTKIFDKKWMIMKFEPTPKAEILIFLKECVVNALESFGDYYNPEVVRHIDVSFMC